MSNAVMRSIGSTRESSFTIRCLTYLLVLLTYALAFADSVKQMPKAANPGQVDTSIAADTVIRNAKIHTVNDVMPSAAALAIKDGIITYIGNDIPACFIGIRTQVIDAGGRLVLPGFQDAHVHVVEAGINESLSVLPPFGTAAQYRAALRQAVAEQPGDAGDWVIGAGVNMAALLESVASPLTLIDEAIPNRPAVILDDLGHGAWANSLALAAVGFDQLTANPAGGLIDAGPSNKLTVVMPCLANVSKIFRKLW